MPYYRHVRPQDADASDEWISQNAYVVFTLAKAAIAFAATRHQRAPTTMEILDEVDLIAERAKEGIRKGLAQELRDAVAVELAKGLEERDGGNEDPI